MARTKDAFSLNKMKDTFDDCSETLQAAIKKQNPDVNPDAFDMALRQLVINFGGSSLYSGMNGVIASIQEPKPMYIEAADVLVLARKAFVEGDLEEALKLFALSNDSDNADDLYDALALNNSKSELGIIHASTVQAEESDEEDNDESTDDDVEEDDTPLYDLRNSEDENGGDYDDSDDSEDEDDDEEEDDSEDEDDEEVESKVKLIARTLRLHAEEDEVDNTQEDQTDSEEDNEPMGGTSSSKADKPTTTPESIQSARMQRIAANKLTMDGSDKSYAKIKQFKRAS